jgi:hypothetical protein
LHLDRPLFKLVLIDILHTKKIPLDNQKQGAKISPLTQQVNIHGNLPFNIFPNLGLAPAVSAVPKIDKI